MDEDTIEAMGEQIRTQVALGRFGEPDEVAIVARFLLSDEAAQVTGAECKVSGEVTDV